MTHDNRAVSPVIGVVLMVAITVILAGVIAAFVIDLGNDTPEPSPEVAVSGELVNNNTEYRITVDQVDQQLETERIGIRGAVGGDRTWLDYGGTGTLAAGDSITVPVSNSTAGVQPGDDIIITYQSDSGSDRLQTLTVPEQ